MTELVRKISFTQEDAHKPVEMLRREWLVSNGLGGFASSSVAGVPTRRYHGLLVSALPTPLGRSLMLNHLIEWVRLADGQRFLIGGQERAGGALELPGAVHLTEFRLEEGLPVWRYELDGTVMEKRILMPHMQNSVYVNYRLLEGEHSVRLKLRPSVQFRPLEGAVNKPIDRPYSVTSIEDRLEVASSDAYPPLHLKSYGTRATFTLDGGKMNNVFYRVESERGYDNTGELWSPGYFSVDVTKETTATLVASTESWEIVTALLPEEAFEAESERRRRLISCAPEKAREGVPAELVLAADQFVIKPAGRREDEARARASGEEVRSVIAGYHWFTDWGRDTMISLEGLTLATGRHSEADWILSTFAHYVRDGLIPNMFPEGENQGLYHTADATLWYFHAIDRYLHYTNDRASLELFLPKLLEIAEHHLQGTSFGIGVDASDGLLRQGAPDYQLTWMDAKCDGWVVTPRRGKAVEIQALWYNALRLLEKWVKEIKGEEEARPFAEHARRAYESFNKRFWYEAGGYLYDVIDTEDGREDTSCRPNQLFSISLPNAVLAPERWQRVVQVAQDKLLTPVGLRSLSPDDPEFKPTYHGDLKTRDAAYHQGTVWAWLIGPFIDAWLKVYPDDRRGAGRFLEGFREHLDEGCVGSISEIFDAEPPFTPRGCVAQAWSVAEVLRCLVKISASEAEG
jgi:predicted glycogen debranching enzyme